MAESWSRLNEWIHAQFGLSPAAQERVAWTLVVLILYFAFRILFSLVFDRRIPDVSKRYILHKTVNYVLGIALLMAVLVVWFGNVTGWAAYLGILSAGLASPSRIP